MAKTLFTRTLYNPERWQYKDTKQTWTFSINAPGSQCGMRILHNLGYTRLDSSRPITKAMARQLDERLMKWLSEEHRLAMVIATVQKVQKTARYFEKSDNWVQAGPWVKNKKSGRVIGTFVLPIHPVEGEQS